MSKQKKKAAPVLAHRERQTETAVLSETTISQNHYTKTREQEQGFIESLLPQGEANALSSRELVQLAGFRSVRELQAEIAREREAGALIFIHLQERRRVFHPVRWSRGDARNVRICSNSAGKSISHIKSAQNSA